MSICLIKDKIVLVHIFLHSTVRNMQFTIHVDILVMLKCISYFVWFYHDKYSLANTFSCLGLCYLCIWWLQCCRLYSQDKCSFCTEHKIKHTDESHDCTKCNCTLCLDFPRHKTNAQQCRDELSPRHKP